MSGHRPLTLVHDYLTQRGGAERVVLALAVAHPEAPIYTSFYDPAGTFPEFSAHEIHTLPIDAVRLLRHHHRLALPLLAPAFSRLSIDAEVTICSSSGWAHGAKPLGRKIVYCHAPARWLYQTDRYLPGTSRSAVAAIRLLGPSLRRWDRRAASTADRYLVNSHAVRDRVAELYAIDAEVVHPPVELLTEAECRPVARVEPGFVLCVSRLLPYKNVEAVIEAFRRLPDQRLVVVGTGPLAERIAKVAPRNVSLLGAVDDPTLRWLYLSCAGLVAASYEDFGLTPVEAARFGKPTAALRWGGYLDTTLEGTTGTFFDEPAPQLIAGAVRRLLDTSWNAVDLVVHSERFSPAAFIDRMDELVSEERSLL